MERSRLPPPPPPLSLTHKCTDAIHLTCAGWFPLALAVMSQSVFCHINIRENTKAPITLADKPMYCAGCNVSYTLPPGALLLPWHLSLYTIIPGTGEHTSPCTYMCRLCVQMPFQQGTDPHCRWHFYQRNVTTAIFFPCVCMSVCVCDECKRVFD